MGQVGVRQQAPPRPGAAPAVFVAADVGGTHARIGLVEAAHRPSLLEYRQYACADYPGLDAIVSDFLASHSGRHVRYGVIACAGHRLDDVVINANLPWTVSAPDIRERLGLRGLELINDFEAVAHATLHLDPAETAPLKHGTPVQAPTLVVGPGTGLGAAVCIPGTNGPLVLTTEAGQASFAPATQLELDVLGLLYRKSTYVSTEHLLSGPGLVNLYTALCQLRGESPALLAPAQVSEAALRNTDARALEALQVFCGLLGSVVGDMAVQYGAYGGVYLAGGIVPQIKDFLLHSTFVERFLNKGRMRAPLERVPVSLIEHGRLGVVGAAYWYRHRHLSTDWPGGDAP